MPVMEQLLANPEPLGHFVQLYEADEQLLIRNLAGYIREGLKRGEGGLAIATPEHGAALVWELRRLGADTETALRQGQLTLVDAGRTLARLIVAGFPDAARFEGIVGDAVRQSLKAASARRLRVYGDMAGILWEARQFAAATRLEQLWHKLGKSLSFSLFCAYPVDVFGPLDMDLLDPLLCAHAHLISSGRDGNLDAALGLAINEVLGRDSNELTSSIKGMQRSSWALLPSGESTILWLKKNHPDKAEAVLASARRHYRAMS
jgi:hypothetical protein